MKQLTARSLDEVAANIDQAIGAVLEALDNSAATAATTADRDVFALRYKLTFIKELLIQAEHDLLAIQNKKTP